MHLMCLLDLEDKLVVFQRVTPQQSITQTTFKFKAAMRKLEENQTMRGENKLVHT